MSASMMDLSSIIDDIDASEEPIVVDKGSEQKLRITYVRSGDAKVKDSGDTCEYFAPTYEIVGAPLAKELSDFFYVPNKEKLGEKGFQAASNKIKDWAAAFKVDLGRPVDYEDDLVGLTGWGIMGLKTTDDYGEQNTVTKYVSGS
jgi:hypothetical protein